MAKQDTIADLFEYAIAAEKAAESLYLELARRFALYREIADFWHQFATEEKMHARWLARFRDNLPQEKLGQPADIVMVQAIRTTLSHTVEEMLSEVEDLEDAYRLVCDLENSETNAVFEFLTENFHTDEKLVLFLRSQLADHTGRLMTEADAVLGTATDRRRIKARP